MPVLKKKRLRTAAGKREARAQEANPFTVVAIGCSAGGLHSLTHVLSALQATLPCSIVVVQHLAPDKTSMMAGLLGRTSALKVKQAEHNEVLRPGVVYIAPPDEHLLVGPRRIQLAHSELVHFVRPSIDLLFESVAGTYGPRSIGVVLSGSLRDGSAGIRAIKEAGGTTIAQDPTHAEYRSMPQAAVDTGCIDYVLPLEQIGPMLQRLCVPAKPR